YQYRLWCHLYCYKYSSELDAGDVDSHKGHALAVVSSQSDGVSSNRHGVLVVGVHGIVENASIISQIVIIFQQLDLAVDHPSDLAHDSILILETVSNEQHGDIPIVIIIVGKSGIQHTEGLSSGHSHIVLSAHLVDQSACAVLQGIRSQRQQGPIPVDHMGVTIHEIVISTGDGVASGEAHSNSQSIVQIGVVLSGDLFPSRVAQLVIQHLRVARDLGVILIGGGGGLGLNRSGSAASQHRHSHNASQDQGSNLLEFHSEFF